MGLKRILVIDDEEFCLTVMQQILFRAGVDIENRVDLCMSGYDAIQILEESIRAKATYVLIFTDFSMPQISGISTTKKIRQLY